ncbi:Hypothetical protein ORPV_751 [Orpheovirus IHUMI-LCC2]|uniref:Uncharacterized protein n=1 Tax=Orpheovirus IHUMI-LCC2 TaxID=2023057 RepID=A0A2I2L524_9VIRU|nr:Hypothetical protein ORPV_751 [Orpheovirus IHUMI-LCC2]SNW62655.1 Hypothetical protein ORPV_751 [Orpheovirus IHUMI-LCC2]
MNKIAEYNPNPIKKLLNDINVYFKSNIRGLILEDDGQFLCVFVDLIKGGQFCYGHVEYKRGCTSLYAIGSGGPKYILENSDFTELLTNGVHYAFPTQRHMFNTNKNKYIYLTLSDINNILQ